MQRASDDDRVAGLLKELSPLIEEMQSYLITAGPPRAPDTGKAVQRAYAERRTRDRVFDDQGLFGEPGWDILLEIAAAAADGKRLTVGDAGLGAGVPPTTALRHVTALIEANLIERRADPSDKRRTFLQLTNTGQRKLRRFAEEVAPQRGA